MTVAQWSTSAALNVVSSGTVGTGGVNINEGMNPSGVNDAMRDLMAQLRTFFTSYVSGAAGTMVIGHTAQLAVANTDSFQLIGTTTATYGLAILAFSATGSAQGHLDFYKSANAAIGSATVVASGDAIGAINWYAAQQTGTLSNFSRAAQIRAEVDGVVTSGAGADMPGRIIFSTSADASGTVTEWLRIDSAGKSTFAGAASFAGTVTLTGLLDLSAASASQIKFKNGVNNSADVYTLDGYTDWIAYTPVFSASFGTVTNISIWSQRIGDTLRIRGKFTVGTTTAAEARMSLGFNGVEGTITSDATKVPSLMLAGNYIDDTSAAAFAGYTLIESAVGYITFGTQSASFAGLSKRTGAQIGSTRIVSITAEIPISGW